VTCEACSLTLEADNSRRKRYPPHFLHPFNYLPLLRSLMPFCLTDLLGSVALGGDNPGVVTKPESDIMKHPICVRRERLVALNRLMPRLSLLRTPQNAACRFLFSYHHVPFRHEPAPSCVHSQLIFCIRRCILYHLLSNLPFSANYSPISDKPFVRPSPRFRSVSNCTMWYT